MASQTAQVIDAMIPVAFGVWATMKGYGGPPDNPLAPERKRNQRSILRLVGPVLIAVGLIAVLVILLH